MLLHLRYLGLFTAIASSALAILFSNPKPAFSQNHQEVDKQISSSREIPEWPPGASLWGDGESLDVPTPSNENEAPSQLPVLAPANSVDLETLLQQLTAARARNDHAFGVRILQDIGDLYLQARQFARAREAYEEALKLYQDIGDRIGEAEILHSLGSLYEEAAEPDRIASQGFILTGQGGLPQGDFISVIPQRRDAAPSRTSYTGNELEGISQDVESINVITGDMITLGEALVELPDVVNSDTPSVSDSLVNQHQDIFSNVIGGQEIRIQLQNLYITNGSQIGISEPSSTISQQDQEMVTGTVTRSTEESRAAIAPLFPYEQALTHYRQALSIYRETGRPYEQGEVLNSIGSVYLETGNYEQAMESFQQSLSLFEQSSASGNPLSQVRLNPNIMAAGIGEQLHRLPNTRSAAPLEVLEFPNSLISRIGEGEQLHSLTSRPVRRLVESLQSPSAEVQTGGEPQETQRFALGAATVLNNIGEVYRYRGYYTQALEAYEAALEKFQQLNIPEGKAAVLNNLGLIRNELGQYETSLIFYQQSLALREQYDLPRRAIPLHNLGFAYDQLQQDDRALTYYQEALALQQDSSLAGAAITRNNVGLLLSDRGQHRLALQELNKALDLFQQIGDRPNIGNTLDSIATVYKNQQQFDQAEGYYQQAIATLETTGNRTAQGIVLTNMGDLYERTGQLDKAITTYQEAIDSVFETILVDLQGEELRSLFADKHADAYARLINLLWNQKRYEEAFNYVERAKARAFLSQIVSGPVNLRAGTAADLLQQEQQLRTQIKTLNDEIQSLNRRARTQEELDAIAHLRNTLTTHEQEYADLLGRLQRQNPAAADLLSVTPATLSEIQQSIPPGNVLVEYFVMDDRTLAFLVTRDRAPIPVTLNVSRKDLSAAIQTLYEYDFAALDNPYPQSLRQLYSWLIEPLRSHLPTGSRLQIVPHNLLHYVPFAALTDGDRYLIDDFAIANLPSANVMRFLEEPSTAGRFPLLSLGNSTFDLPSSQEEVEQISTLYNTQPLLGNRASESAVWNQAGQATILHLATHGEYNSISPLFSTLFLSPGNDYDGQLQAHEIYGLDLTQSTQLVVLSACQAQFGSLSRGDEVIGLSRAFMYAGTPKVIASLWSVDDQATRVLMESFYTNLQKTSDEADSLQRAQQSVRNTYPHPYYWASFVLNGLPY